MTDPIRRPRLGERLYLKNARLVDGTGAPVVGLRDEIKQAADTYRRAKDLGIRMCPGGDFGFAWNPHGEYAKDIQVFVDVIGFTPLEALRAATRWGAELMRMANRIGTLEPGRLADLVVVDGAPLRDISVLQDRARLSVMKGGQFVTLDTPAA